MEAIIMIENPLTQKQYDKLIASVQWSERQLQKPKESRIAAIREHAGYHYAQYGSVHRQPVPMISLAVQIYVRLLAAHSPRVLITTQKKDLKPLAKDFEIALNLIPDEINLSETLRKFVQEALFSMGVVKVGISKVGSAIGHDYGEPFVDLVTLDNYFLDMSAKSIDQIAYEGNQYWMDYEDLMESKWLDPDIKKDLKPDEYTTVGVAGERRAEEISADSSADEYRDRCWLRDIWLPREQLLLTVGAQTNKLLRVVKWKGPIRGPYIKLGYTDVPGNLLPLPPVALWRDLHELSNKLFRKLGDQADSQKTVQGFAGGDEEAVENFKKASDGDGIRYTGATPVSLKTGGIDQTTMAFYMQCRDLFSYYAGNLDSLGGLGNQAPTLGQDKLLSAAASAQMLDMADRTIKAIQEIFYALAFYEWHDPVKRRQLEKPVPGSDIKIPVEWNPDMRKGKFDIFDLRIDAYSLQDNSPGVRLQKLGMIMQQYVLPLSQQIKENGGEIDIPAIFRSVAKYADFPELEEFVRFAEVSPESQQSGGESRPSGNSEHTYTRIGQPGQSREGASANTQQILMGGNGRQKASEGNRAAEVAK
jgi:hypothetical protein